MQSELIDIMLPTHKKSLSKFWWGSETLKKSSCYWLCCPELLINIVFVPWRWSPSNKCACQTTNNKRQVIQEEVEEDDLMFDLASLREGG